MARMFGTDGVRGIANEELTPLLAMQLGQAGAYVLTKENEHKPTIMVGCDTRISGDMLANALMAGAVLRRSQLCLRRCDSHSCGCLSDQEIQSRCRRCDLRIPQSGRVQWYNS